MKVIFLDIDGVLNNGNMFKDRKVVSVENMGDFDKDSVAQLNRILEETDARIVISSSWRIAHTKEWLGEHFVSQGILPNKVIGMTPNILAEIRARSYSVPDWVRSSRFGMAKWPKRGHDIELWLERHPDVEDWVAIDDDENMADLERARIIQTQWSEGLREKHADRAIEVLNKVG